MYLAPFIGVGVGVLIELLVNYFSNKTRLRSELVPFVAVALMVAIFFSTSAYTAYSKRPIPVIDAPTTRALLDIKKLVPKHSAMFTPYWEFGYPLMEIGEFATYLDGGIQGGLRATLAAVAMMSPRQGDMVSFLSYVEDHGFRNLSTTLREEKLSADEMQKLVFNYPGPFNGENVHVLYLEKMIWKVFSLSRMGAWDFNQKTSKPTDYVELHCFSMVNDFMTCRDGTIDLKRGYMNDGTSDIPMRAALFVNDGYVIDRRDYPGDNGYYLQVLMKKGKINMILVADGPLFRSNFNQQYLLGNYDKRYFEEVYNDFPVARLFKVKNKAKKNLAETK
jgi:dolichyl-diphosphooligosaccharide--protein glycosyltransferase